jgi:hypothetical protein
MNPQADFQLILIEFHILILSPSKGRYRKTFNNMALERLISASGAARERGSNAAC